MLNDLGVRSCASTSQIFKACVCDSLMHTQTPISEDVFVLRFTHLAENDPLVIRYMARVIFWVRGSHRVQLTCVALLLVQLAILGACGPAH